VHGSEQGTSKMVKAGVGQERQNIKGKEEASNGRMSKRAERDKLMNISTPLPIYCMDGFDVVG
jgi:hypothetical protein